MKFGTVLRSPADGVTVMYIGTLQRDHEVVEANRKALKGDRVIVTLSRGTFDVAQYGEYWPVGGTGWINQGWDGEEVSE